MAFSNMLQVILVMYLIFKLMCFVMCRLKATWMQSTQYAYYIALFVFLYYMIVHFDCISIDLEITTHRPREVYEQFWLRRIRHLALWHLPLFLWLCWNQISDYHIVLKPYNLTFWQSTPLHYTDVLSWLTTFHRVVIENFFQYQLNATYYWNFNILHFRRHFIDSINDTMKRWQVWSRWSLKRERLHWQQDHFCTKSYTTSVANNVDKSA